MAVRNNSFTDMVRVEQLRRIESVKTAELSYASISDMENQVAVDFKYTDFIRRLSVRANRLIQDNRLEDIIIKPRKQFRQASWVCMTAAAILGGLAAGNAVSESYTLDIYWLLTVLLGFNLLSLILWVTGITFNLQGLSSGVAAQFASWLPFRNKENDSVESLARRGWWESCLSGGVGKWRISILTHQFWLVYLTAGLVLLILLMLAKQYNFVWGTTLLPDSSLPKLTESLGKPLVYIGLEIPDSQQIAASRMDTGRQDAATRGAWARFLIGVLLVYGLLPRILLLAVSTLMLSWSEHRFKLDLYLPYFIDLRQRLMARKVNPKIIDADPLAGEQPAEVAHHPVNHTIPINAHALGIELDGQINWPDSVTCRLNIIDQQTHEEAIELVKKLNGSLVIGVAVYRLPDRGVQRIVRDLIAATGCKPWLILLNKYPAVSVTNNRELAWFRLAEACAIPAEHVITQ
ncbi:DUF2868 domain-containing protein [Nitrosomonas aestuarii]|uniref:DUF2868 domain-containing protein n=1 Tax=Nitrosomonas aestuarii TaxID=52441 RepID=UPI000D321F5C|nr:DUF2868 domain-containing protein [Nitrosomonas aestuarii]PTN11721.1 uncharacterized protein DUF2868 [Nitrosomonas aestuarii]